MAVISFPPVENADKESGILAIGGDLELTSLLLAYSQGIFPWPISDEVPLAWFSPDPRGVLDYKNLKISRGLNKFLKKCPYEVSFNQDFDNVIATCAQVHGLRGQFGTWINQDIITAYQMLHQAGFAYSVEVYEVIGSEKTLVGGLYGVCLGTLISGESMFYKRSNASKFALISLMQHLHENEIDWLDTQMVTPVVKSLGGVEIARSDFLSRIRKRKNLPMSYIF